MKRSVRWLGIVAVLVTILVLAVAGAVWVGAVERWLGAELRALAAARLEPAFAFDDLTYSFPRTLTLRGLRLTSADPEEPSKTIEILAADSLTLTLAEIPRPQRPIRMQRLDLVGPTLRLVRIRAGASSGRLLGYSDLWKEPARSPARPPRKLSELFEVLAVSVEGGRVQLDARDGGASPMWIDGIVAKLRLKPDAAGAYRIDLSVDHHPALTLTLRGRLVGDRQRLEVDSLSSGLQLAREQDHYLTPTLQKLLAERDITGRLSVEARGTVALDDAASSQLQAEVELSGASYAEGDYRLALDHVGSRFSTTGGVVTLESFAIDALGGHARIGGTVGLDDRLSGSLSFEGADLQIGDLLRGADDPQGVPSFSGLLAFSGTLRAPLLDIGRGAQGRGRLSLRQAHLARLPVLSTIDEALDRVAEATMKKERADHDVLSLEFSLDGDHARIAKLRMNSHWYGLRGQGDVAFDSRLDLAVDGGPLQRVENELGMAGDMLGEITETLLRARVTGTLGHPKVGLEVLRHPIP